MKKKLLTFHQLLPVILSFLLIAAHFSRANNLPFVIISLLFLLSLLIPNRIIARSAQAALVVAAAEWIFTLIRLVELRKETGQDWQRLAVFLGIVILFNVGSIFCFSFQKVRTRYGMRGGGKAAPEQAQNQVPD